MVQLYVKYTYPDKNRQHSRVNYLVTQLWGEGLGGRGQLSQMNAKVKNQLWASQRGENWEPTVWIMPDLLVKGRETWKYYPCGHTSSSSRKPSYQSTRSAGGWVYLDKQKHHEHLIMNIPLKNTCPCLGLPPVNHLKLDSSNSLLPFF